MFHLEVMELKCPYELAKATLARTRPQRSWLPAWRSQEHTVDFTATRMAISVATTVLKAVRPEL